MIFQMFIAIVEKNVSERKMLSSSERCSKISRRKRVC